MLLCRQYEKMTERDRTALFVAAKESLEGYLRLQGVRSVTFSLSDRLLQQDPNSGKSNPIVNL